MQPLGGENLWCLKQELQRMEREGTVAEERLRSKYLYKVELYLIKTIPVIIAAIYLLNTILSYYNIDVSVLSYIGGMSILPILFFYVSSYVFKFCAYHRIFLHYISLNWVLDIIDYYWGIPVSDKELFMLYIIITGIFCFVALWLHQKEVKRRRRGGKY